jgi:hypothetical protein
MNTIVNNNAYSETHDVGKWNNVADIINSTSKKPTIINPQSKFVIITYWWGRGNKNMNTRKPCYIPNAPTEREPITYDQMIINWENACRKANCNFLAIEYPQFAVPGGYQLAINAKPLFIKKAIELCEGRGVVYIDGDMPVRKYPYIFDMEDYDFMVRHWNIDPRSSAKHLDGDICIDSTIFETSGGIMYFNNTLGSYKLLDNWIYHTFYKLNIGKADDRILSLIMGNKKYTYNLRIFLLPIEYLWLSDIYNKYMKNVGHTIVIEHPECLTPEEMAEKQGAANNREPKFYGKIVTDYIECSKFGGYFWEYIFFENEKQLSTYKPYLNYMKSITINDAYEDRDSDDIEKPPYYFVDYKDQYGTYKFDDETYQSIAEKNKKLSDKILTILRSKTSDMFPSKTLYVTHKEYQSVTLSGKKSKRDGGAGGTDNIYIDIVTDIDSNKIVHTNHVNCTIIALLKLGYEVIFLPSLVSTMYVDLIMAEKFKNYDLEMIFANVHGYIIDSIQFVDNTPIYFRNARVLMHMLHLIKPNTDFMKTFSRIFKSSHHFMYCIRVGLYNYKLVQRRTAKLPLGMTYLSIDTAASLPKSKPSKSKQSKDKKTDKFELSSSDEEDIHDDTKMLKRMFKRLTIARRRGEHQKRSERLATMKT